MGGIGRMEEEVGGGGVGGSGGSVCMLELSKVFDKEKRRLTLCLSPTLPEQRKAVNGCLEQLGWDCKKGRAPPSHMERELQGFLEELLK